MEDTKDMNKHNNKSVESEKHIIEPLHQNNDSCETSKRFEKLNSFHVFSFEPEREIESLNIINHINALCFVAI